jgi:cell division protein FtsL
MIHHHHTTSRTSDLGFTLVEVVLYMAFTTVILLISGAYLLDVLQMKTRLQTVRSVTQGSYVLQHALEGQIDQAVAILSPSVSETANALVLSDGLSTTSIGVSAGTYHLS